MDITVTVNGTERSASVEPRTLLSDFVRHDLGLTGTHVGCEQAVCGSCTLRLDGVPVRSCAVFAVQADGARVETVESLADRPEGRALQRAVLERNGLQCGFCTPGLLMSLAEADDRGVSGEQVLEDVVRGHLCRCTGYGGIRAAVESHWGRKENR